MKLQVLSEALDKPYTNYSWSNQTRKSWKGKFKTADGREVSVGFYNPDLIVGDPDKDVWSLAFTVDKEEHVTGRGDQFRIFATVIKMASEFIKEVKPKEFQFTASKTSDESESEDNSSRAKLYITLVNKFAKQAGYKAEVIDREHAVRFVLRRKDMKENLEFLQDLLTT